MTVCHLALVYLFYHSWGALLHAHALLHAQQAWQHCMCRDPVHCSTTQFILHYAPAVDTPAGLAFSPDGNTMYIAEGKWTSLE